MNVITGLSKMKEKRLQEKKEQDDRKQRVSVYTATDREKERKVWKSYKCGCKQVVCCLALSNHSHPVTPKGVYNSKVKSAHHSVM